MNFLHNFHDHFQAEMINIETQVKRHQFLRSFMGKYIKDHLKTKKKKPLVACLNHYVLAIYLFQAELFSYLLEIFQELIALFTCLG